jgi:hypothetical protein
MSLPSAGHGACGHGAWGMGVMHSTYGSTIAV